MLVGVSVQSRPQFGRAFREPLLADLRSQIATRAGALWQADVQELPWLQPGRRESLAALADADLTARYLPADYDKVFLAVVEEDGGGVRFSCREWDESSQSTTATTTRVTFDRRLLSDLLFAELLTHFRPLAEVETVDEGGKTLEVRLRGGELLPPDPAVLPVAPGAYFTPYYRSFDRKGNLVSLQGVPWTFIRVASVDRGRARGEVVSAFASPIAATRRRVSVMAIGVRTKFEQTELTIFPRHQRDNPLAGTRVDLLPRKPSADDPVADRLTLLTDRTGTIRAPSDPASPLRYLYVMSGRAVLAIVPFIPGDVPRLELEVPDDSPRLAAEGEMDLMEQELIEVVARREVLMARARGLAKADQWSQVDEIVQQLARIPTKPDFIARIDRIELETVARARAAGDRVQEARIGRLCNQIREHVDRHLSEQRVADFQQELRDLRAAARPPA